MVRKDALFGRANIKKYTKRNVHLLSRAGIEFFLRMGGYNFFMEKQKNKIPACQNRFTTLHFNVVFHGFDILFKKIYINFPYINGWSFRVSHIYDGC